jgi:S-adenosylmethionine decarboxylase
MGDHYLLNLYGCNPRKLDDEMLLRKIIEIAVCKGSMTLLNVMSHKFQPQGVTVIALLAESHVSIHTWPEKREAAVDVYTCGTKANPELVCQYIREELNAEQHTIEYVKRLKEFETVSLDTN